MNARDNLCAKIADVTMMRRGPIYTLTETEIMPLVDAYVAEKLAERQEAIATRIESTRLRILQGEGYIELGRYVDGQVTILGETAAWVRDFGKETS